MNPTHLHDQDTALGRLFALQERYRQLASRHPESLPMVRDRIAAGLRALTAAQQWLVATGPGRPEIAVENARATYSGMRAGSSIRAAHLAMGLKNAGKSTS